MRKKFLFVDGVIIPAEQALIDSLSPWKLGGKGVFETMKVQRGKTIHLEQHLRRLTRGLNHLRIKNPYSKNKIKRYLELSLKKNKLKNASIRLTVWKEKSHVNCSIVIHPLTPFSLNQYRRGFKGMISSLKRNERSRFVSIKYIGYAPLMMAYQRVAARGKNEAILLNRKNEIVEGSRTNIFFVKNNILYTPALRCGCLNGITRQNVIKLASQMNIELKQIRAKVNDLLWADEAFLTNSLIGVMPMTSVKERKIGNGQIGPMTSKIMQEYKQMIRRITRPH